MVSGPGPADRGCDGGKPLLPIRSGIDGGVRNIGEGVGDGGVPDRQDEIGIGCDGFGRIRRRDIADGGQRMHRVTHIGRNTAVDGGRGDHAALQSERTQCVEQARIGDQDALRIRRTGIERCRRLTCRVGIPIRVDQIDRGNT